MFLYFIFGIIFAIFFLPLIDGLASLILSLLEIPKGKAALKIAKYNKQIEDIKISSQDEEKNPIGFCVGDDEIEILEEEDENED